MKQMKLLLAAGLVLALVPAVAWAGGTPKQLYGTVVYSNGVAPTGGDAELDFVAYIVGRESETITEATTGCGIQYIAPDCWAFVEVSAFPTPWSVGETCRIEFSADGSTGGSPGAESNTLDMLLDASGSQGWGLFYLPVELTSFTGEGGAGLAVLRWSTATETDNLGFWVWRSTEADGEYAKVNEELIKGAGTTAEPHHYSFTDDGLEGGNYFYKLEDVGATGVTQLHGPVEVEVMAPIPTTYGLAINTPNPVTDRTDIRFQLPEAAHVKLAVYNVAGSLVNTLVDTNLQAGYYRQEWSAQSVASGIYFYRLEANDFSSTHRMVVLK